MHTSDQHWQRRGSHGAVILLAFAAIACSDASETAAPSSPAPQAPDANESQQAPEPAPSPEPDTAPSQEALEKRGRAVYRTNCIACHNGNPTIDGGIGPAVAGSSLELIEARVIRGEYPQGYTPKRDTNQMIALPYLEPEIAALAAFLAQE